MLDIWLDFISQSVTISTEIEMVERGSWRDGGFLDLS